jgi:hypothetical protein
MCCLCLCWCLGMGMCMRKCVFCCWNVQCAEDTFALYFLGILPPGHDWSGPRDLWKMSGSTLELTHNYGTETDASYITNNGNVAPHIGYARWR